MPTCEHDALVRAAAPGDLPALLDLFEEHAEYERLPFTRDGQVLRLPALMFADEPRLRVVVAACDRRLVGYAAWSLELSTWSAAEYAHLDCLYLRADHRGRGLGERLFREVQRGALALGVRHMQWQTPPWNEGALRFYRRLGATTRDKSRLYFTS